MVDVTAFLQSDMGLAASIFAAAWIIMKVPTGGGKDADGFAGLFLPVSLKFLNPIASIILNLAIYALLVWALIPFLITIGLPVFLVIVAGVAYIVNKSIGWPMEQSVAVAVLVVLAIGSGM